MTNGYDSQWFPFAYMGVDSMYWCTRSFWLWTRVEFSLSAQGGPQTSCLSLHGGRLLMASLVKPLSHSSSWASKAANSAKTLCVVAWNDKGSMFLCASFLPPLVFVGRTTEFWKADFCHCHVGPGGSKTIPRLWAPQETKGDQNSYRWILRPNDPIRASVFGGKRQGKRVAFFYFFLDVRDLELAVLVRHFFFNTENLGNYF